MCLTLLSKNPNDEIVQQKNSKNQNLFHVLCDNSSGCKLEHLKRIYETLKKRGVDCLELDGHGRSALHYAVKAGSKELVQMLVEQGADPKTQDKDGNTPLTLYLKGKLCKSRILFNAEKGTYDEIFELLASHGADMNSLYTETAFKSENTQSEYKCCLLINLIR